jgi:hypothetical protein
MSDPHPPIEHDDEGAGDEGTELQFDEAEPLAPTSSGPSCAGCKRPITDAYYEINGKVVCTSCRAQVEASFRGGSRVARVLKATIFGIGGAIAGAVLYYAILKSTGYHIGLVAVVVGFMVGGAVKKGAGGRGGSFYQFLALFLTYSSIVGFHVPLLVEQASKPAVGPQQPAATRPGARKENPANEKQKAGAPAPALELAKGENAQQPPQKAPAANPNDGTVQKAGAVDQKNAPRAKTAPDGPPPLPEFMLSLFVLLARLIGFLYALPVLIAIQDPLSGLIFSFALWEAWKISKGAKLVFNGPFRVNPEKPEIATGAL